MVFRKARIAISFLGIVCTVAAFPILAQTPVVITLPTPAEGNVGGRQGISFWPLLMVDGEERPVDPAGCVVSLVPSDVNERLTHPCGKWIAPPPGRYTVWLEQGDRVSDQTVVNNGGAKFSGDGVIVVMTMNDAGFAEIARDVVIDGQKTARLLSIEPSAVGFEKRLRASEAHSRNRLPVGRAVAGVFAADGKTLALSRPFMTTGGKTTVVGPRVSEHGADLMLVLGKRQASPRDRRMRDTKITAIANAKAHEPDVLYETDGRIVAIWYGITATSANIKMISDVFRFNGTEIRLTSGNVTTVREELDLNTTGVIR